MIWGVQQRLRGIPSNFGGDLKGSSPPKDIYLGGIHATMFCPPQTWWEDFFCVPPNFKKLENLGGTSKSLEKVWGVQKSLGGIL